MSDYIKATNFTVKDTLPSGNANKTVRGTELDTEFTAIQSAVQSKSDKNSPAFTGIPTAPTATVGTDTTQLATTEFVNDAISAQALGNMSTQNKTAVDITGGTIVGITDLTVADGGTGASSITANSVVLGNGANPLSGNLVAPGTSGNILTSNGTTWQSAAPAPSFAWNVTYVNTSQSDDTSYTLPANCIGVYLWCETNGSGNNGGIGKVSIKNGGTELGYVYVGGTNIGGGADGGSGMRDGVGTFIPVPSNATALDLSTITNDVNSSWVIQAYVTKA